MRDVHRSSSSLGPGRAKPTVSVVIRTRDRLRRMERTLRSALAQCDVDLEVILVQDGPDVTGELAQLADRIADARLHVTALPEQRGPTAARNAGIALARGEWVAFLDDDDLWAPDKLSGQLNAASEGAAFVYSSAVSVDDRNRVLAAFAAPDPQTLAVQILARCVIPAGSSNVMVRRAALSRLGGFDPRFRYIDDWDAWIRMAAMFPAAADPSYTVGVVHHAGNESMDDLQTHRDEMQQLAAKHEDLAASAGTEIDEAEFLRWLAVGQRRSGHTGMAIRLYLEAARRDRNLADLGRAMRTGIGFTGPLKRSVPDLPWLQAVRLVSD